MVDFREYAIGDLFHISTGRDVIIGRVPEGQIPLVSHQHENNGIAKYIRRLQNRTLFRANDTISLADRGVFYATVQNVDFHIGTRVKALTFKDGEKGLGTRLYVAAAINKLQPLFLEYSQNATRNLPELRISLPAAPDTKPDYAYMERFVSEHMAQCIEKIGNHLGSKYNFEHKLTSAEAQAMSLYHSGKVNYMDFPLGGDGGLFEIKTPKKKFNANALIFNGEYPYVARGSTNNGIRGYIIQDSQYLNEAHTISFGQDTATIFYQPNPYFTGDKIKVLKYNERNLDEDLALYLISAMKKAFANFQWGSSSFNENILSSTQISLPVTSVGKIDYDFINNFVNAERKKTIAMFAVWKDSHSTSLTKQQNS